MWSTCEKWQLSAVSLIWPIDSAVIITPSQSHIYELEYTLRLSHTLYVLGDCPLFGGVMQTLHTSYEIDSYEILTTHMAQSDRKQ